MILSVIIGTIVCGLFPLLFVPVFRRMEQERLKAAGSDVAVKLAELENEVRLVESHLRELRETAANAGVAERAF